MILNKEALTETRGYWEGMAAAALDAETAAVVPAYKTEVCKRYISLNPEQIESQLGGTNFWVTRKVDGELAVIFWDGMDAWAVNTGGRLRLGLPCLEEAARCLRAAGVGAAIIPAELHAAEDKARARVFDTAAALADEKRHGDLRLAPFDIISLDGAPVKTSSYADVHGRLSEWFGAAALCPPVPLRTAGAKSEVRELFRRWVTEEGAEGLVVRCELPFIYKIKPRFTLDVVVVGFSEGAGEFKGQVRSLLLALMPEEGVYQVVGRTGGGLSAEEKETLFTRLSAMIVDSRYIETDSNHVAFHMIRPEIVAEIKLNDILLESAGGAILNPQLEARDGVYRPTGRVAGFSLVFPVFSRLRPDKAANAVDTRLSQTDGIAWQPDRPEAAGTAPAAAQILRREVYRKTAGAKLMVQKFLAWQTNKSFADGFPAYVFYHVNFSSERKEPLQSDVRVTEDREQLEALFEEFLAAHVKKGWVKL
ncbi:MAG: hypothetical protein LBS10_02395 [Gracilibacteraceae bacterium]|nr:hypothetical protein [Gracilibacteraceae bacterium]